MRNSQDNLVIDGVDWTVTNRRYRRKNALSFAGFLVAWMLITGLLDWIGFVDWNSDFFFGAVVAGFLGYYDGWRDGRSFGRVFQRVTDSTEFIDNPPEQRYLKVYRAPAK